MATQSTIGAYRPRTTVCNALGGLLGRMGGALGGARILTALVSPAVPVQLVGAFGGYLAASRLCDWAKRRWNPAPPADEFRTVTVPAWGGGNFCAVVPARQQQLPLSVMIPKGRRQLIDALEYQVLGASRVAKEIAFNNRQLADIPEKPNLFWRELEPRDWGTCGESWGTGHFQHIGGKRRQEDVAQVGTVTLHLDGQRLVVRYTAVFDGHGGRGAADHAAANWFSWLEWNVNERFKGQPSQAALVNGLVLSGVDTSRSYQADEGSALEQALRAVGLRLCAMSGGTTANIVLQLPETPAVLNSGDSRAIGVGWSGRIQQLSMDQTISGRWLKEIQKRGGLPYQTRRGGELRAGGDGLNMGGAWGDHDCTRSPANQGTLTARGDVTTFQVTEPMLIVQASDGVWNRGSTQQVGKLVHRLWMEGKSWADIAAGVGTCAVAVSVLGSDNVTVLVTLVNPTVQSGTVASTAAASRG